LKVEVWVIELSIYVLQHHSSHAATLDDTQDCFGVSHLAYLTVVINREHLCPFAL
jgi:hypothetical protein